MGGILIIQNCIGVVAESLGASSMGVNEILTIIDREKVDHISRPYKIASNQHSYTIWHI